MLGDDVPASVKGARLEALQTRSKEICLERNKLMEGKTYKVLVEKRLDEKHLLGRTEGNVRVLFEGQDRLINQFTWVKALSAGPVNVLSEIVINE